MARPKKALTATRMLAVAPILAQPGPEVAAAPGPVVPPRPSEVETLGAAPAPAAAGAAPVEPVPAAAEAAPVDPHVPTGPGASPEPANDPDGKPPSKTAPVPEAPTGIGYALRVTGPAKGRWRAGRQFGPEPVEIPVAELSDDDLLKIHGDPELTVEVVNAGD